MYRHLSWKEFKTTFNLSLPLMLAEVLHSCSGFIGVLIVARLGQQALAASALVNLAWFTLIAFSFGMLNAVSILVSRLNGENKPHDIKIVMSQTFNIVLILTLVIFGLFSLLPYLLTWTGQPENIIQLGMQYGYALRWTVPALILLIALEQFLYGLHQTRLIFIISVLQIPLEILAMFVLAFGLGGVPAWGIQGVAYGQAWVFTLAVIVIMLYLSLNKKFRVYQIGSYFSWCWRYCWAILKTGSSIGLMYLVELAAFFCLSVMIAHINSQVLGANQLTMQYLSIILTITMAISQVVTVRVGYAIGQNTTDLLTSYILTGLVLALLITISTALIYIMIPRTLLAINVGYEHDTGALLNYFKQLIALAGVYQIVDCCRVIISGALRAFQDTYFLMWSSVVAFFGAAMPAAYFLGFVMKWASVGIWCGMIIGTAVGCAIVAARLYYHGLARI